MYKSFFLVAAMLASCHAYAQHSSIAGRIRSESGQFLSGATIEVDGLRAFTVADELGRFHLEKIAEGNYELVIRHVGYETRIETVKVPGATDLDILLKESVLLTEEVLVYSTRATGETPATFHNMSRQAITKQNFGQDTPYLLNWTPSLVTTSDAGTGFGYTGLRIRGSDATSINVTINGIPYNDAESLGTFWVDIPDIASSAESIQIQRGVGTSTNGAGAFGATINLQTISRNDQPYGTVINSVGFLDHGGDLAYNSRRHTIGFGTGLINEHWVIDGRFSKIASEGYIDRATADLGSYYLSAGFYAGNTMIKGMMFGGKERTYQAWYGVPQSRLEGNEEAMLATAANEGWNEEQTQNLLNSSSRTFNPYTYENQVDDYKQDHFQLHISQKFTEFLTGNLSFHYTPGKGFYEEFKPTDNFSDYGLAPVVIGDSLVEQSDIVRRRWLDNDFGGATFSLIYNKNDFDLTVGGGANRYAGTHYGEIIWAEVSPVPIEHEYYHSTSEKNDLNVFAKLNFRVSEKVSGFADLQERVINYESNGTDNSGTGLEIDEDFFFFNPKLGVVYEAGPFQQVYASFSVANREPVRSDFVNAPVGKSPKAEQLRNIELGYRLQKKTMSFSANYYLMDYRDQLIHTGRINDVGAPIRTNVDHSQRMGFEIETLMQLTKKITLNANATYSRNKIREFTEILYDYAGDFPAAVEQRFTNTDIAFSPSVVAAAGLTYRPLPELEIAWLSKYVARQFLDNSSTRSRSLDPYLINDLRIAWTLKPSFARELTLSLLANNILGEAYESNGYTWAYLYAGEEYRENYYFPQAGRNYQLMAALRF